MKNWGKYVPILALLTVGLFMAAPAAAQTGSVTGTILDASSGQPLDAVQVSLEAVGTGEVRFGGLTQASGRFLIINVPVAQYVLRAELLGFGSQTQVVDVTGGSAIVVDLRGSGRHNRRHVSMLACISLVSTVFFPTFGRVAELADAEDLKSSGE